MNFYVETMEAPGASSKAALYPTPGFRRFATTLGVGGRAMFAMDNESFGVSGNEFYELDMFGNKTARGTVVIDQNPATISSNGDGGGELFITSGDHGYIYDRTSHAFTEVLTSGATQGGMAYGYFIAFDKAQSQIRISDLFDGLTWDPTQFAQRTIGADAWEAMLVTPYGQILLLGGQTGEFWYNAGTFPFPFAPDPSGLIEEGTAATFSVEQAGKSAVWLSTNKNGGYSVMRATGFTPQRISDHAFEYQVSRYSRVDDAIGQTYEDQGHAFYLLTFPTAHITWAYDFAENKWAKRGTWISENNAYDEWHPVFHCFAFNKHLMADRTSTAIYEMDIAFPLDVDGREIRRVRRAPAVENQNARLFFPSFELLLQIGNAGQSQEPVVMMRWSDDGGLTWNAERQASYGRIGQYWIRCRWQRTGSGRKRVYEVSVTDPVACRISEAYLRVAASQEAA